MKILRELFKHNLPDSQLKDLLRWFCTALRLNKNKLAYYLDDVKGQGTQLEAISRSHFFFILSRIVQRVKTTSDENMLKVLINGL